MRGSVRVESLARIDGQFVRLPIAVLGPPMRRHGADSAAPPRRGVPRDGALFDTDLRGPVAIFVGGEGRGLAPSVLDHADQHVTIRAPPVESRTRRHAAAARV